VSDDSPHVCTVVSCGDSKQALDDGETVPAKDLYTSPVHSCKRQYGEHSAAWYIASAEYGLVVPDDNLPEYDTRLDDLTEYGQRQWAWDVVTGLDQHLEDMSADAVVVIGGELYADQIASTAATLPLRVPLYTPWQTLDRVSGVGKGMAWCNEEIHWPENLEDLDESILGPPRNTGVDADLARWS